MNPTGPGPIADRNRSPTPDPVPFLERWLALAAARLLLRLPDDPGLRRLVRGLLPETDPQAIAAAIAVQGEQLFADMAAQPERQPLARIAAGCGLSAFDLDLLGLACLPCMDEDAAAVVAAIMGGERRFSAGIAAKILVGESTGGRPVRQALRESLLWRFGLLRGTAAEVALLERRLDPTAALLAGLDSEPAEQIGSGWSMRSVAAAAVPAPSIRRLVERLGDWDRQGPVHLAGHPERAEQVLAVAAAPRPCLIYDAPADDAAAPWAEAAVVSVALGCQVALRTDAAGLHAPPPGVPPLPVVAPPGLAVHGPEPRAWRIDLGGSDPLELAAAWAEATGLGPAEADELAGRSWLDLGAPARIAAGLPPDADRDTILARIGALTPPRPLRLAVRREPGVAWTGLVVPPETEQRLLDIVRRVRRRVTVQMRWGMARGGRGLGVLGLFHGESGTGKTLAAEAVATRLAVPLLAVDLSLVVSKYIGETEKNLAELFAAAEGYSALLFFDEADALFGRRTNVQDAHDRYANIEVNFLLQRLESFEGLALLSTNLLQGVDEAFLRRFDQVVQFPRPSVAERVAIWRAHLPAGRVAPEVSVPALAERFDLTGGEIRNAALGAAFAAADGDGRVTQGLLESAVAEELMKKGRPFPGPFQTR